MEDLTPRQQQILNFIKNEVKKKNYPPSVREICKAVGLNSSSTVHTHLASLEKKGYIRRNPTKPRAIEIINPLEVEGQVRMVPIVGEVTAGKPILAEENIEGYFPLPSEVTNNNTVFLLRVFGDSMQNAGILDRDYVIVRKQPVAQNGEIVVALLGEEATVKRFYKTKDEIRLEPDNPQYEPIICRKVSIIGKVIGIYRLIK